VVAVAAVQEEIGGAGARAAAFGLEPELAIVLDVTSATDVPGGDPSADGERRLGSGPAIARGPTVHPALFDLLWGTAEVEGIPATVEVSGWSTASDADVVHLSRAGVPTALVSVPLRYMHSAAEVVQLDDVEATVRLIELFVRGLGLDSDFAR
jgi:endoglucanase